MRTILLVDDDFAILETLAMLFEGEGYRVVKASNGAAGLAQLAAEQIDAVVCDVMMPLMTGPAMLARMAEDPALSKIPVVLMSATHHKRIPIVGQCVAVLAKPFSFDDLLAVMTRALGEPA